MGIKLLRYSREQLYLWGIYKLFSRISTSNKGLLIHLNDLFVMAESPRGGIVHRVRKLNRKTRGFYTHRIASSRLAASIRFKENYATDISRAAESKAFRTHSDLLSGDLAIAACIAFDSSGETRACIRMPLRFSFGI